MSRGNDAGLRKVLSRLEGLNFERAGGMQARYAHVNRHMWRVKALYFGGDAYLAGFTGAVPHQRLWPTALAAGYRQPGAAVHLASAPG